MALSDDQIIPDNDEIIKLWLFGILHCNPKDGKLCAVDIKGIMSLYHTIYQAGLTIEIKCNANSACYKEIEMPQTDGNFGLNRHSK